MVSDDDATKFRFVRILCGEVDLHSAMRAAMDDDDDDVVGIFFRNAVWRGFAGVEQDVSAARSVDDNFGWLEGALK